MTHKEDFDAFMLDAVTHETAPIEHEHHPPLDVFFDSLAGRLAPDAQSAFTTHVVTCPQCQARWHSLNELLQNEREVLSNRERTLDFAEVASQRTEKAAWTKRLHDVAITLLPKRGYDLIWATGMASVAAIVVALIVAIPALWGPGAGVSNSLEALRKEVGALQAQVGSLAQGGITIPANFAPASSAPSMNELVELVNSVQDVADPWQRSLIIASFLAEHKIAIPNNLDWSNLSSYTVQPGDSWESIPLNELGEAHLWPLLFLLNAGHGPVKRIPSPGEQILLPTVKR